MVEDKVKYKLKLNPSMVLNKIENLFLFMWWWSETGPPGGRGRRADLTAAGLLLSVLVEQAYAR